MTAEERHLRTIAVIDRDDRKAIVWACREIDRLRADLKRVEDEAWDLQMRGSSRSADPWDL